MPESQSPEGRTPAETPPAPLSWRLFAIVAGIGICLSVYAALRSANVLHTAALYIGLPVVLASGMALQPKSASVLGASMKALTISLLLAVPLFREGYVCVLMAAPILYLLVGILAAILDYTRKRNGRAGTLKASAVVTAFALMALEGTHPALTFDRHNSVTYEAVIPAAAVVIRARLARTPRLDADRPILTRLFPAPAISGAGLDVGAERRFDFAYNKWIFVNPQQDHVIFRVASDEGDAVRFVLSSDESYLGRYLIWEDAVIKLTPLDQASTKAVTTIRFRRSIDPAWYVQPLQRYFVGEAAKLLTASLSR